ncbi:hypothetical protein ACTXT7_013822 [Hymenolepis weldensis]
MRRGGRFLSSFVLNDQPHAVGSVTFQGWQGPYAQDLHEMSLRDQFVNSANDAPTGVVTVHACQIRGQEIDTHQRKSSDVDSQPWWLILSDERVTIKRVHHQNDLKDPSLCTISSEQ